MKKARALLLFGIFILILPYLGFPYSWKNALSTLTGFMLIYLSYLFYKDYKKSENREENFDNFRENSEFTENERLENREEDPIKLNQE